MVERASMPAGGVSIFRRRLFTRMAEIAKSERVLELRMPVALVLLLDQGNGGNGVASEVAKRFQLLDRESATREG